MIFQVVALLAVIMIAVPPMVPVIMGKRAQTNPHHNSAASSHRFLVCVSVSFVLYVIQVKAVDRGLRDVKRATNNALSPVSSLWGTLYIHAGD